MTLGSLFDGSGGFPLAGIISGIKPIWSSDIEPFPIRVTEKRLPEMKHYGDISLLNGADLEPVDIITFGSPCQAYPEKKNIPKVRKEARSKGKRFREIRDKIFGIP